MITELPSQWASVPMSSVCEINPRTKSELMPDDLVSFVPMAAVSEHSGSIVASETRPLEEVRKGFTPFREGDVLFAKITPCMENGKAAIARNLVNGQGYGSTEFHILRPSPLVMAEWLFAIIRTAEFRRAAAASFQGAVGQQRVTADFLQRFRIPLPPLSEQQRIVDILQEAEAIRRLRAQAEAKTAELIPALFCQGVRGHLDGKRKPLGHWFETSPNYGTMTPADENAGGDGLLCLRVGNIQNNRIDLSDRKYVQRSGINLERHTVRTGDIILARAIASEEHLGKAVVITPEEDGFAFDSHLMRIRLRKDELLPEFLQVYLYSAPGRNAFLKQARQSAVQFNVNAQEMACVAVPDVPPAKQVEVVREIKETEALCRYLESTSSIGSQLNASLSAHAFTGQLTADWRDSRPKFLAKEARKRDDDLALAAGKEVLINFSASDPEDEAEVWKQVSGISREQWLLLFQIRAMNLKKELPRYFTAEHLAEQVKGPLHRHPQAIEAHLSVFAVRGLVIPVSRARDAVPGKPFAASYRLPMNEEGAAPEQRDDVKAERMKHQRTRAAGKR